LKYIALVICVGISGVYGFAQPIQFFEESFGSINLGVLDNNLVVGIGTSITKPNGSLNNPNGYKLAVNGKIGAKEVQVENSSSTWADYVFEPDYKLLPLELVANFIKTNKHLQRFLLPKK
jgi:hypothetical protein